MDYVIIAGFAVIGIAYLVALVASILIAFEG